MTTPIPTPAQPEPGEPVDWQALDAEIFGDADSDEAANAEASRQYARWKAASDLAWLMEQQGADTGSIARAVRESYPEIRLPGLEVPVAADEVDEAESTSDVGAADEAEAGANVAAPLGPGLKWVIGLVAVAAAVLAVLGFVVSFDTQTGEVEPFFGSYAPLVPLAIDLGIVVFAALNLVLARLNMSIMWLRAVPWVLTAMTLYINLSAHHDLVARVAHVALPGMWIIASEVGVHVLRLRAGLEAGTRTEGLGIVRWFLAPVSTARLWRHMRLWGLRTAAEARETEAVRLEAKAALRFRYGLVWRFRAPVQLKTAYRLRRLESGTVYGWQRPRITGDDPEPTAPTGGQVEQAEEAPGSEPPRPASSGKPGPASPSKRAPRSRPVPTARAGDAELVERIRALTETEGRPLSAKRVRREFGVGDKRATRLLDQATAESD